MLARQLAARDGKGHPTRKLVAESPGSARLIQRRARPKATGERLVEKPAVQQQVHRTIGRPDLKRGERVPPPPGPPSHRGVMILAPKTDDELSRLQNVATLAEQEDDILALTRSQTQP